MASYVDIIKESQKNFFNEPMAETESVMKAFEETDPNHDRRYRLAISTPTRFFEPPIEGEVTIEWERTNTPGKMTFTTIKVDGVNGSFHEGDKVYFATSEQRGDNYSLMFVGYVFKKSRDKRHHIEVVCYDQLRYLKNKYSWVFTNKKASEILKSICDDYGLYVGASVTDTTYKVPTIAKENSEAFDVIITALEETLANTGQMYVLRDDNGIITLRNVLNMKLNRLIDASAAQNFEYTSDIDSETYNSIVLYYKPTQTATTTTADATTTNP